MQEIGTVKGVTAAWIINYYLSQNRIALVSRLESLSGHVMYSYKWTGWSLRPSDLTPTDFLLLGHLKSVVYKLGPMIKAANFTDVNDHPIRILITICVSTI
jgi:hypothetical protein